VLSIHVCVSGKGSKVFDTKVMMLPSPTALLSDSVLPREMRVDLPDYVTGEFKIKSLRSGARTACGDSLYTETSECDISGLRRRAHHGDDKSLSDMTRKCSTQSGIDVVFRR
jgi:hypothetical protein